MLFKENPFGTQILCTERVLFLYMMLIGVDYFFQE